MQYGNTLAQKLYFGLPYVAKNAASSLYGLQQRRDRYGAHFVTCLEGLKESQFWSNDRLREFSQEQALRLVRYACRNTPFYRNRSQYCEVETIDDLVRVPILDKDMVRSYQDDLCSGKANQFRNVHTSGTTGRSLNFPVTSYAFEREYAFRALHYCWGGVSAHNREPVVYLSGHPVTFYDRKKPPFWVHDLANNWLLMSSYHLSKSNLESYVDKIGSFQPRMIAGYPSSLYLLALSWGGKKIPLKAIYTASETLFPHQREALEEAFGAKVYDWYGNSERCCNIVECDHDELHLKYEHSFVEILKDDGQLASSGEEGRLICTGFGNEAFPLIRYEVGDRVTISKNQKSSCGRGGLLIERIEGRNEDYVLTSDGRRVGRLDHLFKDSQNVKEAQIVQNEIDKVVLRVAASEKFSEKDRKDIMSEARLRLGTDVSIKIERVSQIERTHNGKFRFIVSNVKDEELKSL